MAHSTVVDSSNRSIEEDEVIEFEFQSSEVEQEDNFFESEETPDTKALDYSSGPLQTGSAAQSGTLLDTRVATTTGSETGAASSLRTGSKNDSGTGSKNDSGTGSGTDLLTGSGTGVKAVSRTSSKTGSQTGSKTGSGQDLAEAGFVDWGDVEMEEKVNLEKKTSKPIKRKKKKRPKARSDLWPSKKVGQKFGRLSVSPTSTVTSTTTTTSTSTVTSTTTAMSTSALTSPTVESETAIFDYDVTTHAVTYLDEATASTYQSSDYQELAGSPTSGANSTDPSQPSGRESQDNVFETSESSSQLCSATETHLRDLVSDLQRQVLDLTTALRQKVNTTNKFVTQVTLKDPIMSRIFRAQLKLTIAKYEG